MDTSTTADNRRSFSLAEFFLKPVPETLLGRTFFWGALPVALFLFTVGVSFLTDSPFSIYFPFLALLGGIATLRWRTVGLVGAYGALGLLFFAVYKEIPVADRLWQMGILFALAVDFYIALLAVEEIEGVLRRLSEVGRVKSKELVQAQLQMEQLQQQSQKMQRGLEEEIKRLKDEAEQRRIERAQDEKRLSLIQSEIDLLNGQKAELVAEAHRARAVLAKESTSEEEINRLREELERAEASKGEEVARLQEALSRAEASKSEIEAREGASKGEVDHLRAELARVEVSKGDIDRLHDELARAEASKGEIEAQLVASREELEKNIELLAASRDELLEKVAQLESAPPAEGVDSADYRRLEGLYTQLRSQFDEKARILTMTRKELFHTQGKLEARELEEERQAADPDRTEAAQYECALNELTAEIEHLESEISSLEAIIGVLAPRA